MVFRARRFLLTHSLELRNTADRLSLRGWSGNWSLHLAARLCTPSALHAAAGTLEREGGGSRRAQGDRGIRDMTGTSVSASCPGDPLRL